VLLLVMEHGTTIKKKTFSGSFRTDALVNFYECRSTFESIEHTVRAYFSLRTVVLPLWVSIGASGFILKLWK
jgi:hypothetical protein